MKDQHKQSDSLTTSRRNPTSRKAVPRLTLRIDFDAGRAVGPGKIKLMELIDKHCSISEGGQQMGMSYRRAWLLVDSLNRCFRAPVVTSQAGGRQGGGASLTKFGHPSYTITVPSKVPRQRQMPRLSERSRQRSPSKQRRRASSKRGG
jgi:molybdate transport repressor ModE-like protein